MQHLRYEHNGNTLETIPSGYGLATIHDKDILIFVISQLIAKMKDGHGEASPELGEADEEQAQSVCESI